MNTHSVFKFVYSLMDTVVKIADTSEMGGVLSLSLLMPVVMGTV